MEKCIQNLIHRCHNKAARLQDPHTISYIGDKSEVSWECEMSESDASELRKHGLVLDGWKVKCPNLDDCKADYILRKIPYVPNKKWKARLRETRKAEPMEVDP